jgi:putative DNA-invertase from lambdoid prophage Rac
VSRIVAYVRVSTDKQDLENQRFEIERFCRERGYTVDEWDEEVVSGTIKMKDRKVGALLAKLQAGDTLVVSELSRISRSMVVVLNALQDCIDRDIKVVSVKESMTFGNDLNSKVIAAAFGLAAEIERSLISARTREALARKKAQGIVLGRPVGTHRHEHLKLHGKNEEILHYMAKNVSRAAMARLFDVNVKTLREYIKRENIEQEHRWRLFKQLDV